MNESEQAQEIALLREYKEAIENEVLIDTDYDAPDESWVDAVAVRLKKFYAEVKP